MRRWLCIVLLLSAIAGCQLVEKPQTPETNPVPESTSSLPKSPAAVTPVAVQGVKEPVLLVSHAAALNINANSADIEFVTNLPSTAVIRLIENETEIAQQINSELSMAHHNSFTNLKPAFYTVVINAQHGSQVCKQVVRFTTLYSGTADTQQQKQLLKVDQGEITAWWDGGDGSMENNIWTFAGYPGFNKWCRIRINNQTARYYVIETSASNVESPLRGASSYSIDAHVLEVPPDGIEYVTFNAVAQPSAPQGIYKFYLKLIYHYCGEFVIPIDRDYNY